MAVTDQTRPDGSACSELLLQKVIQPRKDTAAMTFHYYSYMCSIKT